MKIKKKINTFKVFVCFGFLLIQLNGNSGWAAESKGFTRYVELFLEPEDPKNLWIKYQLQ